MSWLLYKDPEHPAKEILHLESSFATPIADMHCFTALVLSLAGFAAAAPVLDTQVAPDPNLQNHTRPVVDLAYAKVEGVQNPTLGSVKAKTIA